MFLKPRPSIMLALAVMLLATANSQASRVALLSAISTVDQPGFNISNTLVQNGAGWAPNTSASTGVYTNSSFIDLFGLDATLTFSLDHAGSCCGDHQLGHFRLSATSDAAPSVAGSWVVLGATTAVSTGGETITINPGVGPTNSILVTDANQSRELYTVQAPISVGDFAGGITGFRLEAFDVAGNGLPTNGPGTAGNGNFVLTHFAVDLDYESTPFAAPRDINVANHSFEDGAAVPSPPGFTTQVPNSWLGAGGVGGLMTDHRGELIPRPDGSATHAWSNGQDLFQVTGETIEANTLYTLTVDMGSRTDVADNGELRLGAGGAFGVDLLDAFFLNNPNPAGGTWETWEYSVFVEEGNSFIGQLLRIELIGLGAQPQFDNVRLIAQHTIVPEPTTATLGLIGMGGLLVRRRRAA